MTKSNENVSPYRKGYYLYPGFLEMDAEQCESLFGATEKELNDWLTNELMPRFVKVKNESTNKMEWRVLFAHRPPKNREK